MFPVGTPSRPRPPAIARRTSSRSALDFDRPPPYAEQRYFAPASTSLAVMASAEKLGTDPFHMMSTEGDGTMPPASPRAVNTALNGRTREELEEMLLAAHNIIRQHEGDLTRASLEAQALRDQNRAVMTQLGKLSARLPQSPSADSFRSRSDSVYGSDDGFSTTRSPPLSPRRRAFQTPNLGHGRGRSNASPVAIAQLADQNAELVAKLDQLQEETNQLDQAGKRKLRKLEQEIDLFKEELEQVQQRNIELEKEKEEKEKERHNEAELERRRQEREDRARVIREALKQRGDSDTEDRPNFAPSGSSSASASPARRSRQSNYPGDFPPVSIEPDLSTILSVPELPPSVTSRSDLGPSRSSTISAIPPMETAIVIQLLAKIEELENANREFIRQRAETAAKIQSATEEVNSMKQAYQDAEDEVIQSELDFGSAQEGDGWRDVQDSSDSRSTDQSVATVLSPSGHVRKSSSKSSLRSLRTGPRRAIGNRGMMNSKKARRPLTTSTFMSPSSSFGSPSVSSAPAEAGPSRRASMSHLKAPNHALLGSRRGREKFERFAAADFSMAGEDADVEEPTFLSRVTSSIPANSSLRAVPSIGDMAHYIGALGLSPAVPKNTLESELGGEWQPAEDDNISRRMFETASNAGEHADAVSHSASTLTIASRGNDMAALAGPNPAIIALQTALEPGNRGRPLEQDEHILPVGCLRSSPVETFYGLSLAVAARPQRWTDDSPKQPRITIAESSPKPNQFPSSPMRSVLSLQSPESHAPSDDDPWDATLYASCDEGDDATASRQGSVRGDAESGEVDEQDWDSRFSKRDSALIRLNQAFMTRRHSILSNGTTDEGKGDDGYELVDGDEGAEVDHHDRNARYDPKALARRLQNTSLQTFLEIWLILQFVMVLAIFVYSSVRQGPRAVMLGQKGRTIVKRKVA